jgi:hypothetical protein
MPKLPTRKASKANKAGKPQEPAVTRPLNEVFHEWWRRLQSSSVAREEFHRALRKGELVASLYQEGKGLRALGRSYWRRARPEFDREEPLVVVVMQGDVPQQGSFYVSPTPQLAQRRALRRPAPVQLKHAGGRPPSFTPEQTDKLQEEQRSYERVHPSEPKKDVEQHLQNWAGDKFGVTCCPGTIRKYMAATHNKN